MASGDTLLIFLPYNNEPPATNYATFDTRNGHPVLDFDATTDESAIFTGVLPRHYSGNGINVFLHFAMTSATSGSVVWEVSFERIGSEVQNIDSNGFANVKTTNPTVPATCGHVKITSIGFSDGAEIDSIAVGEAFRLKVSRDADGTNGTDDASGDAELLAVEVCEA